MSFPKYFYSSLIFSLPGLQNFSLLMLTTLRVSHYLFLKWLILQEAHANINKKEEEDLAFEKLRNNNLPFL